MIYLKSRENGCQFCVTYSWEKELFFDISKFPVEQSKLQGHNRENIDSDTPPIKSNSQNITRDSPPPTPPHPTAHTCRSSGGKNVPNRWRDVSTSPGFVPYAAPAKVWRRGTGAERQGCFGWLRSPLPGFSLAAALTPGKTTRHPSPSQAAWAGFGRSVWACRGREVGWL